MSTLYLTGKEPLIRGICSAAFPNYRGNMFTLETAESVDIRSYWSGGSRDTFCFVDLATLQRRAEVPTNGNGFDPPFRAAEAIRLPDGIACVRHSIFCGKDSGLTIIVNPATLNPSLLPGTVELSRDEQIVLIATRSFKSSYGGRSDYRFTEAREATRIDRARWDSATATLKARGLLNAAGAITVTGKNAIGRTDFHNLREAV